MPNLESPSEKRSHYVSRCMADPEVKGKKPNIKQRLGYCEGLYDYFKKKHDAQGSEPDFEKDTTVGIVKFLPEI